MNKMKYPVQSCRALCKGPVTVSRNRCISPQAFGGLRSRRELPHATSWQTSRKSVTCRAEGSEDDSKPATRLGNLVARKHAEVGELLAELGEEGLEERMQSALSSPVQPPFQAVTAMAAPRVTMGVPAVVLELARPDREATTTEELVQMAQAFEDSGAEVIALRTDSEYTTQGLRDLFEVCRAVKVPVLRKELMLHPIQVVESKEAGAAGIIGIVTSVLGKGMPILSKFAAAIGLDCPVEVVNMEEMSFAEESSVPVYGINLSVGLSVKIPGFAQSVMSGLIDAAPFGSLTVVGAKDRMDAEAAARGQADAIFLKWDGFLEHETPAGIKALVSDIKYAGSGDD